MNKDSILVKLQTMTLEEKLTLLSDTDKAYVQNYLDRVALKFRPFKEKPPSKRLEKKG